jgi:hypothetical protein
VGAPNLTSTWVRPWWSPTARANLLLWTSTHLTTQFKKSQKFHFLSHQPIDPRLHNAVVTADVAENSLSYPRRTRCLPPPRETITVASGQPELPQLRSPQRRVVVHLHRWDEATHHLHEIVDRNNFMCTSSLGLQVQSAVASVFSAQGWPEGLYRTLGKLAKNFCHFPLQTTYKKIIVPRVPNYTVW